MKSLFLRTLRQSIFLLFALFILSSTAVATAASQTNAGASAIQSQSIIQSAVSSVDWSGYAVTGATFNKVESQVTVPTVTCATAKSESLFWVGLDGYQSTSNTVEQIGVGATCTSVNSAPHYFAWWQMFAKGSNESFNQIANFTVEPGYVVAETVTYNPTQKNYVLQLSHGSQSFSTTRLCAGGYVCGRQSAEWVAERYTTEYVNGKAVYTPLAKWSGNAVFNKDWVVKSTSSTLMRIDQLNNAEIYMYDGGPMATPGSLETDGTEFGVSWVAAE